MTKRKTQLYGDNGAGIEENKAKITNNLKEKHESIKMNGTKGAKKDKKRKR